MNARPSEPIVCADGLGCWLLPLVLCVGCGRFGYENLGSSGAIIDDDEGSETASGADLPSLADGSTDSRSDAGAGMSDAGAVMPEAGGVAVDAGLPVAEAGAPRADTGPVACGPCGLGESCIAGSCVTECSATYATAIGCEGFENGLGDLTLLGAVSEETSVVHTGTAALGTQTTGVGVTSRVLLPVSPALSAGTLYFRGYYYIATPPTAGLIKLAGFNSSDDGNVDLNVNPDRSLDLYFHEMGGARLVSAAGSAVFGAWMCLQVVLEISDTNGKVSVSVDGVPQLSSPADRDTRTASGLARAELGIAWSEDAGSTVVYVDDVVLDSAPVPCQ